MHTQQTQAYKTAIHLSKLIPLGKKTEAKKQAVHKLMTQIKVMLAKAE